MIRRSIVSLAIAAVFALGVGKSALGFDGYILYGGHGTSNIVLRGGNSDTLCKWNMQNVADRLNGYSHYLMENGNLLRSSQSNKQTANGMLPKQGILSEIDYTGKVIWKYELANLKNMLHHDCKILPNGNLLVVSFVSLTEAEALTRGLDASVVDMSAAGTIQTEKIMEVKPDKTGGNSHQVVWEWDMLDHVIPKEQASQHPEKFSAALGPLWFDQWVHLNGIDYNPGKDLILFTSRIFSEVYVIDHSTTTAQAKTGTGGKYNKGGDLLYRWGNLKNYGKTGGFVINTLHSPTWIPVGYPGAGNIMFFHNNNISSNNGFTKKGRSEVVEFSPPYDETAGFTAIDGCYGPAEPVWKYSPAGADSMSAMSMSTAIRMRNGNTIVHEAYVDQPPAGSTIKVSSRIREVKPDKTIVGDMIVTAQGENPAKIMYYEKDNPGIIALKVKLGLVRAAKEKAAARLGLAKLVYNTALGTINFSNVCGAEIAFYTLQGKRISAVYPAVSDFSFSTATLSTGTYCVKITGNNGAVMMKQVNVL